MNVSLTEKGEDNDNSGDRGVGGIHSGVSVVLGGRLIVGGDIQRLRSILPYTSIEVIFESPLYLWKYCKMRALYWLIQNQHNFKPHWGHIWTL